MHRFAAHDHLPVDGVPFIGPVDLVSKNVWVATGYRKWGLALATAAGGLLADLIDGRDHAWAEVFDTRRVRLRASATSFAKENANVGLRFFGDRIVKRARTGDIPRGEGRVVGTGLSQHAVYRDEEGACMPCPRVAPI